MESSTTVHDPLIFGASQEDVEVMEDLTEQLGNSRVNGDDMLNMGSNGDPHSKATVGPLDSSSANSASPEPYTVYGQLATPPTYEDSMMYDKSEPSTSTMVDEDITSPPPATAAPVEAPPKEQFLYITVSDPAKKENTGMFGMKNAYVLYKVATKTSLSNYRSSEFAVRRRFREVVELADVLKARFRGYFVPPRPEKNAVEGQRMKESFVEDRRVALEKYLNTLARHPVIAKSDELRLFLEVEGELSLSGAWAAVQPLAGSLVEGTAKLSRQLTGREAAVLDPLEAAKPNRRASNLLRTVKESVQGLKAANPVDSDEVNMRKQREDLEGLKDALTAASRAAETLVAKQSKVGTVFGDMALAFLPLSKFEEASGEALARYTGTMRYSGTITAECRRMAASCLKVSKLSNEVTGRSARELAPLHDHLSLLPSAIRAFASREHQLLTQQTLEAELDTKQRSIMDMEASSAKTFSGAGSKMKRVDELRADCQKLEMAIVAAKQEYNKIKTANLAELLRLTNDRTGELRSMVEEFAAVQAAASEQRVDVWLKLAQDLGASASELAAVNTSSTTSARPSLNGSS